ncbi:MAG: hypothetical protein PHW47_11555 [Lachnospira sp.]|jgi:archaellum component FlaC|nr:hypothetical protein [Lachnospira sp.]
MTNEELFIALTQRFDKRFDSIDSRLDEHDSKFDRIDSRLDGMDSRLDGHDSRFDRIENELRSIKITQENEILPRLQTIESCYLDTYQRYVSKSDQIDKMQYDIDSLKIVVAQHSDILQKDT